MSAKKTVFVTGGLMLAVLLLASCQQVFTYSPLSAFQSNPANMSPTQKKAYAQSVLASGDATAMKKAYDAIKGSKDAATNLLAGQLAFGASGATQALSKALPDLLSGSTSAAASTLQSFLNDKSSVALVTEGAQNIKNAVDGGQSASDSELAIAAAGYAITAADQAGGFDNLANLSSGDPGYQDLKDAGDLVNKVSSSQQADLKSALEGMGVSLPTS